MPAPLPGVPLVRAKTRSCEAVWMPVFQVFSPVMTQSPPPAFPVHGGLPPPVPPGPSPFTRVARVSMNVAVVEKPDVVVLVLQWPDLALDELVEFGQVTLQVLGKSEVHVVSLAYPGRARWPGLATVSLSTAEARTASTTSSKR